MMKTQTKLPNRFLTSQAGNWLPRFLSGALLTACLLSAHLVVADESGAFRESFLENIELTLSPQGEEFVGTISRVPVYEVHFEAFPGNSPSPSYAIIEVFESGDELVPVVVPSMDDEELPYFLQLIHPDFRLTEDTADDFLGFLESVMPEDFFDEVDVERITEDDGVWRFFRGTFFDKYSGFLVEVDDEGRVQSVTHSLDL